MSINGRTVSIPSEHHLVLVEMAAAYEGIVVARQQLGDFIHPGDPLGTILCEAWRIDETKMILAMTSYMSALREESRRLEVPTPSLADVLTALPLAVNTARFPDVDVAEMKRVLARNVPECLGIPEIGGKR